MAFLLGAKGSAVVDVSAANPLPVTIIAGGGGGGGGDASAANQVITNGKIDTTNAEIGALTETAPTTDTASSGLNGRLQRVAQRLTSLIGLVPVSLGSKLGSGSFSIVPASDANFPVTTGQLPATIGAKTSALSVSTAPATDAVFPPGGVAGPAATSTNTQVTASVTSVTLQAANTARRGRVSVFYSGAALLSIHEGAGAATAANCVCQLGSNGLFMYETPDNFTGVLTGIWSAVSGAANVTERTA